MNTVYQNRIADLLHCIQKTEIGLWNAIRMQDIIHKQVQTIQIVMSSPNQIDRRIGPDEAKIFVKMFTSTEHTLIEYEILLWELFEFKSKLKQQLENLYLSDSRSQSTVGKPSNSLANSSNQPIKHESNIKVPLEESPDEMDFDNNGNDISSDEDTKCDVKNGEQDQLEKFRIDTIPLTSIERNWWTNAENLWQKNKYICDECGAVFRVKSTLLKHLLGHANFKPFHCDICDRKFAAKRLLRAHMQMHSTVKLSCPHCPKVFNTKNAFNKHLRVKHIDTKIFSCAICSRQFDERTKLTSHMRFHTGEKRYNCSECNQRFKTSTQRTSHIRKVHTGERPFECGQCHKRFMLKCQLNQHMFCHTDERPSHCNKCERSFKTINELKRHQIVHAVERPFVCEQCNMGFKRFDSLSKHILTHAGQRLYSYTCELCGAQFTTIGNLNLHIQRKHSEERRHPCFICNKRFPTNAEMKKHMVIHTRCIQCNECGKTFDKDEHRRNHMKVHSGEFAHVCRECDRGFSNRKNMVRHIRLSHEKKN